MLRDVLTAVKAATTLKHCPEMVKHFVASTSGGYPILREHGHAPERVGEDDSCRVGDR